MAQRAGIDASIPLQGKRPDMLGLISELVGIRRQQTALAGEQQSQTQRANLAKFDVSKIIGDDGTIDLNKIPGSGLREAAGDQFPDVLQQYAGIRQQQLTAKQSLVQLTDAQRGSFGDMMGALRSDPDVAQDTPAGRQKVVQAFGQYAQMYGKDAEPVLRAYAAPIQHAPPGKLAQTVQNIQLQATSASEQAGRQAPTYTSTGAELRQTNPYAQSGQAPAAMPLTIAPGEQATVLSDQLGNQFELQRDARGNFIGVRPLGGGGGQAAGPGAAPARFGPGERQAIEQQAEANFRNVDATRIAASLAPQQLDQINKALDISRTVETGGKFAGKRAEWESTIASIIPGLKTAADDATKLQLLDKFAERIAADSARVLGANASTDAARESITRQNANIGYTPKAVQEVLKYAKAQTMAMAAKGDAQEQWLKAEGNGITKAHEFETKWRQAYDPVVYQLEAAAPNERRGIIEKLPKAEAASLAEKRKALRELGALK
jgi:hypothetical protein